MADKLNGWPFINHAVNLRRINGTDGHGRTTIVIPRAKYTFLIELQINPAALDPTFMVTNLREYINNGRIYGALKGIDHPKANFKTETFRSYNRPVKVHTAIEHQPAVLTLHDDTASMAAALWKEYVNFYHYTGAIGIGMSGSDLRSSQGNYEYSYGSSIFTQDGRSKMDTAPSLGMKLRPQNKRHFFDRIAVYDFGQEPDSVNAYYFFSPVITQFAHDGLDFEDRTEKVGIQMTIDYEGSYAVLGQNRSQLKGILELVLDVVADIPLSTSTGHIKMLPPAGSNQPLDPLNTAQPNLTGGVGDDTLAENTITTLGDLKGQLDHVNGAIDYFTALKRNGTTNFANRPIDDILSELVGKGVVLTNRIDTVLRQPVADRFRRIDLLRNNLNLNASTMVDYVKRIGKEFGVVPPVTRSTIPNPANALTAAQRARDALTRSRLQVRFAEQSSFYNRQIAAIQRKLNLGELVDDGEYAAAQATLRMVIGMGKELE